ncbi:hypothetical protein BHE90_006876 [Fusarium euwallaceae]|uniref:Uncharacterized protein n=1 Tax=Fusarium euwallaceae TaxID=1147111 RepID=A0A430LSF0_9HYPO|nr:hypothetical protein BHE90_006876 [Fusarium euwallaceae]
MLRDLGSQLYPIGRLPELIVTFPDGMTDICFGGDEPTQPMLLDEESYIRNRDTQDARFIRNLIPSQVSRAPEHSVWHFSDAVEWLPLNFDVVNRFTVVSFYSSAVTSMRVAKFLQKAVTDATKDGQAPKGQQQEVFGKRMLMNELIKESLEGNTGVVQEC